jgi:2-amino-4-hydroxy-6-hydroxymethyldihydropteridine diphosphokinase
MEQVWISLGSNVGDRLGHLRQAIAALRAPGKLTAISDAYETEPVGPVAQPWFLNAVAGLEVDEEQSPERLLETLLAVERAMGRERSGAGFVPKGPRTIDLDIILYGSRVVDSPGLKVPHPEMHLRRFVLEPLAQVAPEAMHPLLHRSALELLRELAAKDTGSSSPVVRRFAALSLPEVR